MFGYGIVLPCTFLLAVRVRGPLERRKLWSVCGYLPPLDQCKQVMFDHFNFNAESVS